MKSNFATKEDIFEIRDDLKLYVGSLSEEFQNRLSGIAEIVAANREDIVSIKEDLNNRSDVVDGQLSFIGLDLNNKTDKKDFLNLERRVTNLERKNV